MAKLIGGNFHQLNFQNSWLWDHSECSHSSGSERLLNLLSYDSRHYVRLHKRFKGFSTWVGIEGADIMRLFNASQPSQPHSVSLVFLRWPEPLQQVDAQHPATVESYGSTFRPSDFKQTKMQLLPNF